MHRQWMSARRNGEADFACHLYNKARNKLKSMLRRDKRLFEKRIAMESKSNPKAFWSHTLRKLKTKSGVASLLENEKDNNSLKFDDKNKANILQKQVCLLEKQFVKFQVYPIGRIHLSWICI